MSQQLTWVFTVDQVMQVVVEGQAMTYAGMCTRLSSCESAEWSAVFYCRCVSDRSQSRPIIVGLSLTAAETRATVHVREMYGVERLQQLT